MSEQPNNEVQPAAANQPVQFTVQQIMALSTLITQVLLNPARLSSILADPPRTIEQAGIPQEEQDELIRNLRPLLSKLISEVEAEGAGEAGGAPAEPPADDQPPALLTDRQVLALSTLFTQRLLNPAGLDNFLAAPAQALEMVGIPPAEHHQIRQYLLKIEEELKQALREGLLPVW